MGTMNLIYSNKLPCHINKSCLNDRTSDITNFSKLCKFFKSGPHYINYYKYFTTMLRMPYNKLLIYKFDFNFSCNASVRILTRRELKHTLVYLEKSFKVKTFVRNCRK